MNINQDSHSESDMLWREAGGNPWVLTSIIERELAAEEAAHIAKTHLYGDTPEEFYKDKLHTASLSKELAGIKEPDSTSRT